MPCTHVSPVGEHCSEPIHAKDLCARHYKQQWRRSKAGAPKRRPAPVSRLCTVVMDDGTDCGRKHKAHGMCNTHLKRAAAGIPLGMPFPTRESGQKRRAVTPVASSPLEPWDPSELKHATLRQSKPAGRPGSGQSLQVGRRAVIDPGTYWNAWRALCLRFGDEPEVLAEMAGLFGIDSTLRSGA